MSDGCKYGFPPIEVMATANGILVCTAKDVKSATTDQLLVFTSMDDLFNWMRDFDSDAPSTATDGD